MTKQKHADNADNDNDNDNDNDAELRTLQRRRDEVLAAVKNVPGPKRPVRHHVVYGAGATWGEYRYGGVVSEKP